MAATSSSKSCSEHWLRRSPRPVDLLPHRYKSICTERKRAQSVAQDTHVYCVWPDKQSGSSLVPPSEESNTRLWDSTHTKPGPATRQTAALPHSPAVGSQQKQSHMTKPNSTTSQETLLSSISQHRDTGLQNFQAPRPSPIANQESNRILGADKVNE